jgi:hypothetical protein
MRFLIERHYFDTRYLMALWGDSSSKVLILNLLHQGCPVDIKKLRGLCFNLIALL